ncbi:MAG TPA: SapC family protein [Woeseiaceae bacterium]|nr:SapC family protein [Woeseiaceae bacterium]
MANYALLNNVDHQDVRIITARSADYGDKVMSAVTFPNEFRNIQAYYPILFHSNAAGETWPVALFGFERGENLFLDAAGWHAAYVPAMVRREPFLIGFQKPRDGSETEPARVLSLDMDHPRVSRSEGEALFLPLGGRTPYLEETAALLEGIYAGQTHGAAFVAALEEQELLEPVTLDIRLTDGSRNQLLGFHALNEDRIRALPGLVLEEFSREGYLLPMFMVLASMANVRKLIDLKNQRLSA